MTLSIDIGGTKISAGIVSDDFKVSKFTKIKTPQNKDAFLLAISDLIEKYKKDYDIKKIGIGCAGLIDKNGTIVNSPNLSFLNNFNLMTFLSPFARGRLGGSSTDIKISNDAQCFTLGEAIYGAGKDYKIVLGITIGTGFGGGITINKKSFKGSQGFSGEFGHFIIDKSSKKQCTCGNFGCLGQFVRGKALEEYYKEISEKKLSSPEIEELSYKNDRNAIKAIEKIADYLGIGLANLVHILNPDAIIIGGSIGKTRTLFEPAIKSMRSHLLSDKIKVEILQSKLGDDAVLIGASLI